MKKSDAVALWAKASKQLKELLHPDVFSRWIAIIDPISFDDETLELGVDNEFYLNWLEEHYLTLIKDAVVSVSGTLCTIQLRVVKAAPTSDVAAPEEKKDRSSRVRSFLKKKVKGASLNPKYTFDDFIIGPSNNFAQAAAFAVSDKPARAYNPLFIYGDVGLGKTHLMQSIGHHILNHDKSAQICYLSSESFTNEYIDALQNRSLVQFRRKYRNMDVLLIDDIHFLAGKERMQEEFFHTFNALFDAHKQIVMTCDRPASEIPGLEQRLVSRFEWGLVTQLELPDLETRTAILKTKQAQANIELPSEIVDFIATNVKSNIRRLEGAMIRTMSYASLTGRELTISAVENLLKDTLDKEQTQQVSVDLIQRTVAEHYDVRLSDMSSKRRQRSVALPRQVAMFLSRKMTPHSLPDIANSFGKTHATILHAYRSIDKKMGADDSFRREVTAIADAMGHSLS